MKWNRYVFDDDEAPCDQIEVVRAGAYEFHLITAAQSRVTPETNKK